MKPRNCRGPRRHTVDRVSLASTGQGNAIPIGVDAGGAPRSSEVARAPSRSAPNRTSCTPNSRCNSGERSEAPGAQHVSRPRPQVVFQRGDLRPRRSRPARGAQTTSVRHVGAQPPSRRLHRASGARRPQPCAPPLVAGPRPIVGAAGSVTAIARPSGRFCVYKKHVATIFEKTGRTATALFMREGAKAPSPCGKRPIAHHPRRLPPPWPTPAASGRVS